MSGQGLHRAKTNIDNVETYPADLTYADIGDSPKPSTSPDMSTKERRAAYQRCDPPSTSEAKDETMEREEGSHETNQTKTKSATKVYTPDTSSTPAESHEIKLASSNMKEQKDFTSSDEQARDTCAISLTV